MQVHLKSILVFLNKSYPFFYGNRRNNISMALLASVFVLYTMLILKPDFILSQITGNKTFVSFAYALITFVVFMAYCELFPRFFLKWFENWCIFKELVLTFSCIATMGILNYLFFFLGRGDLNWTYFHAKNMAEVVFFTLISGMVPLLILSLFNFLQLERKRINARPISLQTNAKSKPAMLFVKESNEEFVLDLAEVSLIESMGNYVKIYQSQSNQVSIKRITMNRMEELLNGQQALIRIHRSYFINISHVDRLSKSESGDLSLICRNLKVVVPVSRSKKKEITNLIKEQFVS